VYDHKDIAIFYITPSTTIQGSNVAVIFRKEKQENGQKRTQVFPLAQAMSLFEDVLARHVHAWKHRYPKDRFPYLQKYMNYKNGDYPQPRGFPKSKSLLTKRYVDVTKMFAKSTRSQDQVYQTAYIDSGSDTFGIGGNCWVIDTLTSKRVEIAGYDTSQTVRNNVPIGSGITAVDLPSGETVLLRANEATVLGEDANTLMSVTQMRENGVGVFDIATRHGGLSCLEVEGYVIPISLIDSMMVVKIRKPSQKELKECTMVELTSIQPWTPSTCSDEEINKEQYCSLVEDVEDLRTQNMKTTKLKDDHLEDKAKYLLYPGKEVLTKTFQNTTRYGSINLRVPMRQHYKSRNPLLQRRRLMEPFATDTWFSTVTSYEGYNCAQVFFGIKSKYVRHFGMKSESDGPTVLLDFFRQEGVPLSLIRDNSKMQAGRLWTDYCRRFWVKDQFTEPYHSGQNPAERSMSEQKDKLERVMIDTGCAPEAWFRAACHVADVNNITSKQGLEYRTPTEVLTGETPDISALLEHQFWDPVYFMRYDGKFPTKGGNEKLGRWLGRAHNYGDKMCYWILDEDTKMLHIRSMVRPVTSRRPNKAFQLSPKSENNQSTPIISFLKEYWDEDISQQKQHESKKDLPGSPTRIHHPLSQIAPDDLVNCYIDESFTTRNGKPYKKQGQVMDRLSDTLYRVQFKDGKNRTYDYEELINKINKDDEDDTDRWNYEAILDHKRSKIQGRQGRIDVLIKWEGYEEPTWEPIEVIKADDPVTLAGYARDHNLLNMSSWNWAKKYVKNGKKFTRLMRQMNATKRRKAVKYLFGYRVPRSIREAYEIDKNNGNKLWTEAIEKETKMLYEEYKCFHLLAPDEKIPQGYKMIPLIWTFTVKFDGRHRARCVAGGHVTDDLDEDLYSGVVNLETVRLALLTATIFKLKVTAADVGSAYIQAYTNEKVFVIAGPEFGSLQGRRMLVVKALYGLKSSGAMWHRKLADNLRGYGFRPCKADPDFWMRKSSDNYYEYIAVIVDDLLIFSRDPERIIDMLKDVQNYTLSGVGIPEYYSGADLEYIEEFGYWSYSAKTYSKSVCDRIEKLLELTLKQYGSPMEPGDHPECDETDFLVGTDISLYQMLIGCAQWAVTLGRMDIQYATNTLARYNAKPREGHKKRALHLFGYLKHFQNAKLHLDPNPLDLSGIQFVQNDWKDLYPDAEEYVSDIIPQTFNKTPLQITIIVDASHADDLITRRSVTGYVIMIGNAIIRWYSKRQNTIESSTYGSELVAMRIAVEALLDIRYKLRMMGLSFEPTSNMLCDNYSVVINTQLPTSSLKKKHNSVAYHKCREAVAAGIVRVGHIDGKMNIADVLTKPKSPAEHYDILRIPFFKRIHMSSVCMP
jgi:hypothetical protein